MLVNDKLRQLLQYTAIKGARGSMVISHPSSNPGQDCLHFTL